MQGGLRLFGVTALALALFDARARGLDSIAAALPVSISGCSAVLADGSCEVADGSSVRVFVPGVGALVVSLDGKTIDAKTESVPGGQLATIATSAAARRMLIRRGRGENAEIRLQPAIAWPWLDEARKLRGKGDLPGAIARAEPALSSSRAVERAMAHGLVGRIELSRGNVEAAIEHLRASASLHEAEGRLSDRAEDSFALTFVLNQRTHRFLEARKVLDAVAPSLAPYPDGVAKLAFNRAEVALESGDVRSAIRGLRETQLLGKRLGLRKLERNARTLLAAALQIEGHVVEGIEALRALDLELATAPDGSPCERAEVLVNLGFSIVRANEVLPRIDGAQTNVRLLSLFPACPDPYLRAIALHVAALDALDGGRLDEAAARLDESKKAVAAPRVSDVLYRIEIAARIAQARGRFDDAKALFRDLAVRARSVHHGDRILAARLGEGEVLEAEGDLDGALASYLEAERVLDDKTLALPLGEGRGLLLARNERPSRRAIELLVRKNELPRAFALLRRVRARALVAIARTLKLDTLDPVRRSAWETAVANYRSARSLLDAQAKDDWKLTSAELSFALFDRRAALDDVRVALDDALSALGSSVPSDGGTRDPEAGEVWLSTFQGRDALFGFAASGHDVRVAKLARVEDLVVAFAPELRVARRVVVLPHGPLRAIDVHALLLDGAPVVDRVPVVYAIDATAPKPVDEGQSLTVVAADPTDDLPAARDEARALVALFAKNGGRSVNLLLGNDANAGNITTMMSNGALFHYAGHGAWGGPDGIDARLPLASGASLTVLDVLALPRVARTIVLSACEAARSGEGPVEGLGLAAAFVIAGAQWVIAPTKRVPDAFAAKLAIELHRVLLETKNAPPPTPDEALRSATMRVRDDPTWTAYRALRP